ncbi:MAG: PTS sugar transporter subunit IIA [Candidatus Tritonobacter lacicola]|nr:PTS sugar transporter subunit IIA [Candidatus Tritonobacter lacicola]
MKLSSLLQEGLIIPNLAGKDGGKILEEMVDCLLRRGAVGADRNTILKTLRDREALGSTAAGHGVAFPHARIEGLKDVLVVLGISHKGVDFRAPDGRQVKIFALVLTSKTESTIYLRTLAAFAKLFSDNRHREKILSLQSARRIIEYIASTGIAVKERLTAKDIMTTDVVTISPEETLKTAIDRLFKHNLTGLPVIDNSGHIIGELTGRDIIKIGLPEYFSMIRNVAFLPDYEPFVNLLKDEGNIPVKKAMHTDIVTVSEDSSIIEIAYKMVHERVRRVHVLRDGKLAGIIMRKDLIRKVIRA